MERKDLNNAFFRVTQLHRKYTADLMQKKGISYGQPNILHQLFKNNGCKQCQLADKCFLEPASMTTILNRMEKANLIERRPDSSDKRVSTVWITPQGEEVHRMIHIVFRELNEACFSDFTESECEQFAYLLNKMSANIKQKFEESKGEN